MKLTKIPAPSVNPDVSQDTRVRTALTEAQRILRGAQELEKALNDDPTLNEEGRVAKLSDYAAKNERRGCTILDNAHLKLRQELQKVEDAVDATLQQPREAFVGAEFRRTIAEMEPAKRKKILEEALKAGPEGRGGEVLGAVFKVPHWMLGLTDHEVENLRNRWILRYCKDEKERMDRLTQEISRVQYAGAAFLGEITRLTQAGKKAREAMERTQKAFHSEDPPSR